MYSNTTRNRNLPSTCSCPSKFFLLLIISISIVSWSCKYYLQFCQQVYMLIFWIKIQFNASRSTMEYAYIKLCLHYCTLPLPKTYGILCAQATLEIYCNYIMMCLLLWIQQPFLHLYLLCSGAAASFKLLPASSSINWMKACFLGKTCFEADTLTMKWFTRGLYHWLDKSLVISLW